LRPIVESGNAETDGHIGLLWGFGNQGSELQQETITAVEHVLAKMKMRTH